jgi:hypothetical protein
VKCFVGNTVASLNDERTKFVQALRSLLAVALVPLMLWLVASTIAHSQLEVVISYQ